MNIFRFPSHLQSLFHFLLFAGNNTTREAGDEVKPNPLRTNFLCCSFYNIFARHKQYWSRDQQKIDLSSTLLSLSSDLLNLSVYLKGEEWSELVQLMCIKMIIVHFKLVMHFQKLALARLLSLMELIPQGFLLWNICINIRTREIKITITIIINIVTIITIIINVVINIMKTIIITTMDTSASCLIPGLEAAALSRAQRPLLSIARVTRHRLLMRPFRSF